MSQSTLHIFDNCLVFKHEMKIISWKKIVISVLMEIFFQVQN